MTPPEKWQGPPIESPVEQPPAVPEAFGPWKQGKGELNMDKAFEQFDKAIRSANPPAQSQASASVGNDRMLEFLEKIAENTADTSRTNDALVRQAAEDLLEVPA